jgi:hypothetical protein
MEKIKIKEDDDALRIQYFVHTLQVFHVEFLSQLKEWDQLIQVVEVSLRPSAFSPQNNFGI